MKPSGKRPESVDLEEAFFARENARLLEELRGRAERQGQREMLKNVVGIDDDALLDRLIAIGIGPETAIAMRLVPLVFVAWADGSVDARERAAILRAATEQGLAGEKTAQRLLEDWLEQQPQPRLLELWKDYVSQVGSLLTPEERDEMRRNLLTAAREVAGAAGGFLGVAKISNAEQSMLDELAQVVG